MERKFEIAARMRASRFFSHIYSRIRERTSYFFAVSNQWTGLVEWTTGMDFDLFSFFSPKS